MTKVESNEVGRQQFFEHTSDGKIPEKPDPYFLALLEGKRWFNVQQAAIRETYLTWEWDGWYSYWLDWKGERWVLRHLFKWHPVPPEWLFKEEEALGT